MKCFLLVHATAVGGEGRVRRNSSEYHVICTTLNFQKDLLDLALIRGGFRIFSTVSETVLVNSYTGIFEFP